MSGSLGSRALLAIGLFFGFYALALGLALGFAALPLIEMQATQRIHVKIALLCWLGSLTILWSILPRWDSFAAPGPLLRREQHPALFEQIDAVATATDQAPPVEVYLVANVNAFVAERWGILGFGRRRVMGLGLPLLEVLTVPQLRAVLAHEFGHFHGGDTALGPWVYRTRAAMQRTVHNLQSSGNGFLQLMSLPFQSYGKMFLRLTLSVSRAQERAADALAARVEGPAPLRAGLQRVHEAAVAYGPYLDQELNPILSAGFRPPVAAGFSSYLVSPNVARSVRAHLEKALEEGSADPFDSHPCLRERIELLAAFEERPPSEDDRPATVLLGDLDEAEAALLRALNVSAAEPIGWERVGEAVALPQLRRDAVLVQGVSGPIGGLDVTPEALAAIGAAAGVAADRALSVGAHLLTALVLVRLVEHGFALQSRPGEPYTAVKDDVVFAPGPLLTRIASGQDPSSVWGEALTAAGLAEIGSEREIFVEA